MATDQPGRAQPSTAASSAATAAPQAVPNPQTTQVELPFTDLNRPGGVAVDTAGDVYTADTGHSRVLELPAGSTTQVTLPFTGLLDPDGVAVDNAGNVYVEVDRPLRARGCGGGQRRLEARHRVHARVEGFIRCGKDTGLARWPRPNRRPCATGCCTLRLAWSNDPAT